MNITFYDIAQTISFGVELWSGWYNEVLIFRGIVVDGKFILIFSFLFGFGMVMLQESSQAKGRSFNRIYTRRLTALLLVGLIHGILIWYGDVLTHYALMGFLLMLFQRASRERCWSGRYPSAARSRPADGSKSAEPFGWPGL